MADLLKLHKEFLIASCPVDNAQTFNISVNHFTLILIVFWLSSV